MEVEEKIKELQKYIDSLNDKITELQSQLKEVDERIKAFKTGDTIRVILTKVKNNNILYSIVDSLDGELMVMDIKPLNEVMDGVKKLLNNEFNLKTK